MNGSVNGAVNAPVNDAVHLVCPVYNGARFLPEFVASVQAQTHEQWQLWMVDDGSADDSASVLAMLAAREPRLRVLVAPRARLGAMGAFAWLLEQVPPDAAYVACADQDDVWLPTKLAHSLVAMRNAEAATPRPVLVHTDLEVVGPALEFRAPSYWRAAGIVPEPATFRRLVAQNVVTGCTMLFNRALLDLAVPIPAEASMHDAWIAGVAALAGCVVALPEATVRYRQHGHNTLGARQQVGLAPWSQRVGRAVVAVRDSLSRDNTVRRQMTASARQAAALLTRFEGRLPADDLAFLQEYSQMPTLPWWARKRAVSRLHCVPEHGWMRNLGVVCRA